MAENYYRLFKIDPKLPTEFYYWQINNKYYP